MSLDDPDRFALIVPTFEGTPFLRRTLSYLRDIGYPGLVVLADDSSGAHRAFVDGAPAAYPEVWLEVHAHPHRTRFLEKLCATLERLPARFVMLCAQDDFVVPSGLEALLSALERDATLSAARGRVARFSLVRSGTGASAKVELHRHPMREYLDEDPVARVLEHMRDYTPALYSMHRRDLLLRSFRVTEDTTRNVIFFQYLSSCITAFLGRIQCLDALYYVRQGHPQSWAAQAKGGYDHWPRLLAAPNYSAHYQAFRGCMLGMMALGAENAALGQDFDDAYIELVRRSLYSAGKPNRREDEFFARLSRRDSPEGAALARIVDLCLQHPETF